ncbi:PREDICTED: pancreatic triacylglycerol lipase-like [Wasmannia auropunctata]|uniref:pancreatic triacylglycerol lipase-like n=1 Tax=Wasmannia auropunctata TaxID=64793 RepID=UPI0005F07706|nr:PREDICTED: pancreatic triacylglycerol lipase-like [Wasmannia auropunctata]
MTRSTSVYICLLVCLTCFAAPAISNRDEEFDPRKIFLTFPDCDATNEPSIQCMIEDTDCIQSAYNQVKKDKNETTVFFHGYRNNINVIPTSDIISAYCWRNISVIALLDWSLLGKGDLMLVGNRTPKIGRIVASTFNSLNNKGYEMAKWHLVGHSMGAHIAGCVGTYSNFTFLHITGLDPGEGPFYSDLYKGCLINPKVAHFTDALYTDRGGYATPINVGSLNVYANTGAAPQPGCCSSQRNVHACSHIKAGQWYADIVRNETKYLAVKCVDCTVLPIYGYCKDNERIYFGPHVDTKTTGTYCLSID